MAFNPSELKISTMTCMAKLNTDINIFVLGKFLKLGDNIKEIKYRNLVKKENMTSENQKASFYNQVTVKIKANNTFVNMKIFPNGQVQMTGCKSESDVLMALENIKKEIYAVSGEYDIDVNIENNLIVGSDNTIYSKNNIIGFKLEDGLYEINKEKVSYDSDNYFISPYSYLKSTKKNIYNSFGEKIGLGFLRFNTDRRIKNKDFYVRDKKIYNSKNEELGEEVREISGDNSILVNPGINNLVSTFKTTTEDSIEISDFRIVNINSIYDCNMEFNRESLKSILDSKNIFSKFDPNTYPAINVKYIFNEYLDGVCHCKETCRWVNGKRMSEEKGGCKRISLFVFQSGKIIITGGDSLEQINTAYEFMNSIILKNFEDVLKRKFVPPQLYKEICE